MPAKNLIVIVGPTAVGKTAFAVELAQALKTEIISADSRQVYREMSVGTAKPSPAGQGGVIHHFIDSHSIHEPLDAATFGLTARSIIASLFLRYDTVVVCGGSGLYIQALLQGFDEMPDVPPGVRHAIVKSYREHGLDWLRQRVQRLDPRFYEQADQQNPQRLMRALELLQVTQRPLSELRKGNIATLPYQLVKIGLELPRPELYERIDQRVEEMINQGLWAEAEALFPFRDQTALQTVGYQEIFEALAGAIDRNMAVTLIKRNTRRYAKRQLTWFRRDAAIRWFDPRDREAIFREIQSQLQ